MHSNFATKHHSREFESEIFRFMKISIDSAWGSTNFMNKFTSIEPASFYFSNCNPAYLPDTSRFYRSTEHICAFANILIVTHVGGAGWRLCHCRWRGEILSTCWLYHYFAELPTAGSIAPWKSDMTFALGRYRECSRQPIRVILRESS